MARVIKKWQRWLIGIFTSLAGLFSTACLYNELETPCYGIPCVNGSVMDLTGKGITNIQLELKEISLTTTSRENGNYSFDLTSTDKGEMTVIATDIDGTNNGSYQTKTAKVTITDIYGPNELNITIEEK